MREDSIQQHAVHALRTADPEAKAAAATALRDRLAGPCPPALADAPPADLPLRPARPARPVLLSPARMPRRRHAGSERGRFALLHAVAHIELNAIDLALDIVARFGHAMPPAFAADWIGVAAEEALHFRLVAGLLARTGGAYGDLPAHDSLWEAAEKTSGNLAARLAIVPLVLEARGLDVTPGMAERLAKAGDGEGAAVLARILADEIGHVAAGRRWFCYVAREAMAGESRATDSGAEPAALFRRLVHGYFKGPLKPPFNDSARLKAGLTPEWYS